MICMLKKPTTGKSLTGGKTGDMSIGSACLAEVAPLDVRLVLNEVRGSLGLLGAEAEGSA